MKEQKDMMNFKDKVNIMLFVILCMLFFIAFMIVLGGCSGSYKVHNNHRCYHVRADRRPHEPYNPNRVIQAWY